MFPAITGLWMELPPAISDPKSATATTTTMDKPRPAGAPVIGRPGGPSWVPALPCAPYAGPLAPCSCTCGINLFRCGLSSLGRDVLLVAHTLLHTHVPHGIWFRALVAFWLAWAGAPASMNRLPLEHVVATVFECFNNSYILPSEFRDALCRPDPVDGCRRAALTLLAVCETGRLTRAWSALAGLPVTGDRLRFVMSDILAAWLPSLMVGQSRYTGGLAHFYTLFAGLIPAATRELDRLAYSVCELEDPTTDVPTLARDHLLRKYPSFTAYVERRSNPSRLRNRCWNSVSEYMAARAEDGGWRLTAEIVDTRLASRRSYSVAAINESIYMFEYLTAKRRQEDSDTGAISQGFRPAETVDTEAESPGGLFVMLWGHLGCVSHCWDPCSVMPAKLPATAADPDQIGSFYRRSANETSTAVMPEPRRPVGHRVTTSSACNGSTEYSDAWVGAQMGFESGSVSESTSS